MSATKYEEIRIRKNTFHIPLSMIPHFNADRPLYLGKGGYGVVGHLNSRDPTRFPDVAIKKLDNAFRKPKISQRCYRELKLLSRIQHENIVKLIYAFSPDSSLDQLENVYLVTEYAGEDLFTLIGNETLSKHSFYLKDFKQMLTQLLTALQFLNQSNVIHRDLKPQNIAVKPNGKLTLLDFGLARVIDSDRDMTNNAGTPYYRAIETISECDSRYDERADIWSVGAILCEMITGSILFEDKNYIGKAIQMCGPVGERVLSQIKDESARKYLEEKSANSKRINFIEHLEKYGRSWMKKELQKNKDNLQSFIDRTLQFDQTERMTVDEALSHPFLSKEGRIPFWNCIPKANIQSDRSDEYYSHSESRNEVPKDSDEDEMFETNEDKIYYWRECIWTHLNLLPNPFILEYT